MALTAQMATIDCTDPKALAEFWTAALGYVVVGNIADGAYVILAPPEGQAALRIGLQRVPEPKAGKNRVHIDFSASEPLDSSVERLLSLGATLVDTQEVPGFTWKVLADPEGNVFCVSQG